MLWNNSYVQLKSTATEKHLAKFEGMFSFLFVQY